MKINCIYRGPLLIGRQYGVLYAMQHHVLRVPVFGASVTGLLTLNDQHPSSGTVAVSDMSYEFNPLQITHKNGVEKVGVWLPTGTGPENFWEQFMHLAELKQTLLRALDNAPNAALEHYLGADTVNMIRKDAVL